MEGSQAHELVSVPLLVVTLGVTFLGVGVHQEAQAAQRLGGRAVRNPLKGGEPAGAVGTQPRDGQGGGRRPLPAAGGLHGQGGPGGEPSPGVVGADRKADLALEGVGGTDDGDGKQHAGLLGGW